MRLLVCGSRDWTDKAAILTIIGTVKTTGPLDTIVQGGNGYLINGKSCRTLGDLEMAVKGADALAYQAAKELGLDAPTFWADWTRFGLRAGMMRNTRMLVEGKPDMALAFHPSLGDSKGTKNMVEQALKARLETFLYDGAAIAELGKHNAEHYGLKL